MQRVGAVLGAAGRAHPEVEHKAGVRCLPSVCEALGSIPSAAKSIFFPGQRWACSPCAPLAGTDPDKPKHQPRMLFSVCPHPAKDSFLLPPLPPPKMEEVVLGAGPLPPPLGSQEFPGWC